MKKIFILFGLITISFSCKKDKIKDISKQEDNFIYNDTQVDDELRINQLQYLSSHNSYRKFTDKKIFDELSKLVELVKIVLPNGLMDWEYEHEDLYTQLGKYGVRHVELDIYGDRKGGRFYNRAGYFWTGRDPASHIAELKQPGLKIMHIPDLDFETHYYTFVSALKDIKRWSDNYPDHLPVFIMIEVKTVTAGDVVPFLGFTKAEPWIQENIDAIENEILQVFDRTQIIKPDDIRKDKNTLREGVLENGWPTVGESRGKVMFMFDNGDFGEKYSPNNESLKGKLVFTNAKDADAPDAAFVERNDPDEADIEDLVRQGFLVRSMIGGVDEARSGDYTKWNLAQEKGVHFLSTDYYRPDKRAGTKGWTDFHVGVKHHSYQDNPIAHPQ